MEEDEEEDDEEDGEERATHEMRGGSKKRGWPWWSES